jgi:hypothetical protein
MSINRLTCEEHLELAALVVALWQGLDFNHIDVNEWPKNSQVHQRWRQLDRALATFRLLLQRELTMIGGGVGNLYHNYADNAAAVLDNRNRSMRPEEYVRWLRQDLLKQIDNRISRRVPAATIDAGAKVSMKLWGFAEALEHCPRCKRRAA